MIAWMLYTVLVSACLFVAASAAEWLLKLRRRPVRAVWVGAALACVCFAGAARFRAARPAPAAATAVDPSTLALMASGMQTVQRAVPPSINAYAFAVCVLGALAVMLAFAVAYRRVRRARLHWPTAHLHGHRVRLSPGVGPVVIGVVRPEITVPRWIMDRAAYEQRLILEHEASHIAARDPLLLFAGCALAALMPWNPALWLMVSRLRLAIELDCDARVLRAGGSPRAYGTLLVDVAEHVQPIRFASLALSDAASHLQQRILAMDTRRPTHPVLRAACVALVGAAGLLAACEASVPTAADIAHMDASSAERTVKGFATARRVDSAEVWMVDGKVTSAAAAKAIVRDSITSINVTGFDGKHALTMRINTRGARAIADTAIYRPTLELGAPRAGEPIGRQPLMLRDVPVNDQPIAIVDGKRVEASALRTFDRDKIAAVEVVKGPDAIKTYGPDAANGVIVVRTKP